MRLAVGRGSPPPFESPLVTPDARFPCRCGQSMCPIFFTTKTLAHLRCYHCYRFVGENHLYAQEAVEMVDFLTIIADVDNVQHRCAALVDCVAVCVCVCVCVCVRVSGWRWLAGVSAIGLLLSYVS